MFSLCPRCDNGKLDSTGRCVQCGYTLRHKCEICGNYNIPSARFCGGCGRALSFKLRLRQIINQHLSLLQKIKIRKFAAGAAFGSMLALFAFGSMGMHSERELSQPARTIKPVSAQRTDFQQPFALSFAEDLDELRRELDPNRKAVMADLTAVVDLLIRHLRPLAITAGIERLPAESAAVYAKSLHNFSTKNMTRGSTTVVFFHFLSDLLDFQYRDFSQEGRFSDIPRFHFLTVPANALTTLGVNIARNDDIFGINDNLTTGQLLDYARDIMLVAETSFELKTAKVNNHH